MWHSTKCVKVCITWLWIFSSCGFNHPILDLRYDLVLWLSIHFLALSDRCNIVFSQSSITEMYCYLLSWMRSINISCVDPKKFWHFLRTKSWMSQMKECYDKPCYSWRWGSGPSLGWHRANKYLPLHQHAGWRDFPVHCILSIHKVL